MSLRRPHFLVLTFPFQSHIAPALRLARRLLEASPDALVTFSTTEVAHGRMFPAKSTEEGAVERDTTDADGGDGRLEFVPFSDGTEAGRVRSSDAGAFNAYMESFHAEGARSVGELLDAFAARGRPVSRVVYTLLLPWAADVARERGIPSALYWIQPVAVFAIYHHYFHGLSSIVADHLHDPSFVVEIPGLAPQTIGDLPSFLTQSTEPSDPLHSGFTTKRDLPYLFVIREDNKAVLNEAEAGMGEGLKNGMIVQWCNQVRVLSHAAVGCFVTHCGWNSVLESMACGIPMVGVPRLSDQRMNVQLIEHEWHVGIRAEVDNSGILRVMELRRCIEEVMGKGEAATEVRRMAGQWKQVLEKSMGKEGSSDRNLVAFVSDATSG
ncbi:hypothetical protein EJB05_41431, partial [Eragrostis curvula]